MTRRYLDHNATTPLRPRVRDALVAALDVFGNPSSTHGEGRAARDLLERARRQVAGAIAADPADLVFTSGGTEADALGVVGLARAARAAGAPARVLIAAVEHPAVHGAAARLVAEGFECVLVPATGEGVVEPDALRGLLAPGAAVVAVALANHELGTLQPIPELAAAARDAGAPFHCDAVQALGKHAIDVAALGADAVALSAHKIGGPKGAGALWIRPEVALEPPAPGHQERGRRPGTEPQLAAVGFGAAAAGVDAALADAPRLAALRDRFEAGIGAIEGSRRHGAGAARVANTANVAFAGAPAEVLVAALDLEGVAVSTGAACTSGTVEPSPVLRALGVGRRQAAEALRVSLGPGNDAADIEALLELLPDIVARSRRFCA